MQPVQPPRTTGAGLACIGRPFDIARRLSLRLDFGLLLPALEAA